MKLDELIELLQATRKITGNVEVRASALLTDDLEKVEVLQLNADTVAVIS